MRLSGMSSSQFGCGTSTASRRFPQRNHVPSLSFHPYSSLLVQVGLLESNLSHSCSASNPQMMRPLRLIRTPWPSRRSAGSRCGAPAWWQRGWPRQRIGSVAEAELLAPLAELLMPQVPIAELFRSFPSPKGWGGNYLEPDLAAYGVLKDANAALFVEYDGYWRHGEKEGMERDRMKNAALLKYAPRGSYVVRISHTISSPLQDNVLWVCAQTWRSASPGHVSRVHGDIIEQTVIGLKQSLHPEVMERLQLQTQNCKKAPSSKAIDFIQEARAAKAGNSTDQISQFLRSGELNIRDREMMLGSPAVPKQLQWFLDLGVSNSQLTKMVSGKPQVLNRSIEHNLKPTLQWFLDLGLSKSQVASAGARHPPIFWYSIDQNLKPTVEWFLDLGMTKSQVAKAVAAYPQILGLSIDQNLKPTVQWFVDLGMTKSQVAKAVATHPRLLGYSLEQNLKPTLQWFLDLGLSKSQVASAGARHPPIFWYSIDQNLKPTVEWFLDLGMTKSQVARAVAAYPQILGLSIDQNLKPTVQWFVDLGMTKSQVAKAVATHPRLLGYSLEQNLKPTLQWFLDLGLSKSQVASAGARHPPIFWYSIDQNLKPTVEWFLDLGMTKSQVARAVAAYPQILGLSIEQNLKPKVFVLNDAFTANGVAELIAKCPPLLGYSYQRLTTRLNILAQQDRIDKLTSVMPLTEETFQKRFQSGATRTADVTGWIVKAISHHLWVLTSSPSSHTECWSVEPKAREFGPFWRAMCCQIQPCW